MKLLIHLTELKHICNRMDNGNKQDLCVPSLFSVCMVDKVQNYDLGFSFHQSCSQIKGLKRVRVELFI